MIKQIARSELFKTYAGAIAILLGALPAVGSLVISVVTVYRGEPYAQKTWVTLRSQVDEQTGAINALNLKLTKMESLQEGLQLGRIQGELEALQKQYDRLRREKMSLTTTKLKEDNPTTTKLKEDNWEEQKRVKDVGQLIKDYTQQQQTLKKALPRPLSPLPANP